MSCEWYHRRNIQCSLTIRIMKKYNLKVPQPRKSSLTNFNPTTDITATRGPIIKIGSILHQRYQQQNSNYEETATMADDLESMEIGATEGEEKALTPSEQAQYYETDNRDKLAFQNYLRKQAALREAKER